MKKRQRKNLIISSPILFSLCFFSSPFLEALSFDDLIHQDLCIITKQDDNILNIDFTPNQEDISIPLPNITAPSPVFSEETPSIEKEFLFHPPSLSVPFLEETSSYEKRSSILNSISLLPEALIKHLPKGISGLSIEKDMELYPVVLDLIELQPLLSESVWHKNLTFKEDFIDDTLSFLENFSEENLSKTLGSIPSHIDIDDSIHIFIPYTTMAIPAIKCNAVSIEKKYSTGFSCSATKEPLLYSLLITFKNSLPDRRENLESTPTSFTHLPTQIASKWIYSDLIESPYNRPLSPITIDLKTPLISKTYRLALNQDVKLSPLPLKPLKQTNLEYRLELAKIIPEISTHINAPSIAFKNSFPLNKSLFEYTKQSPFQEYDGFLNSDFLINESLITYIFTHTPIRHNVNIATQTKTTSFIPKKQDSVFNYSVSISSELSQPPDNIPKSKMAFEKMTTAINLPLYMHQDALEKQELLSILDAHDTIDSILINDLNKCSPKKISLNIDVPNIKPLSPNKESLCVIKLHSHSFLEQSYNQIAAEISPFNSLLPTFINSLQQPSFIACEKYAFDNSSSLFEFPASLELLGSKLSYSSPCEQNPALDSVNPHQETPLLAYVIAGPHPDTFFVSYDLSKDESAFLKAMIEPYTDYTSDTPISTPKYVEPSHYCILFDNDFLNTPLASAPFLYQDVQGHLKNITPHDEDPSLSQYQQIFTPDIKEKAILISSASLNQKRTVSPFSKSNPTPSLIASKADLSPSQKKATKLNQSSRNTHDNLSKLPTLQELNTLSLSEEFSIDLEITPNTKEKGYLFSINLEPVTNKLNSGAAQNFIFLVDRSSSIDKNRFQVFKQAISKSLLYLKDEDTFNILTFDTELSKMSHDSVYVSSSTKHSAKRFLETQRRGYKFVLPNLYQILLEVQSMSKNSPLPTTVVLLTNGKTLENFNPQDDYLSRFVSANQKGFTLFTACASQNNNTLMLEILSHLNKGEFMHSQTNAAFPRKLASFVKHAGYLLANDIHISAAKTNSDVNIEFFPDTALAPNLYGDKPYTIIGKIDKLCDFDLVLQGRFCDNWLNITKKVSFKTARNGGHSIYKDYTIYMAYNKYREFLKDGNTAYLDEAKKVLQPLNTTITY